MRHVLALARSGPPCARNDAKENANVPASRPRAVPLFRRRCAKLLNDVLTCRYGEARAGALVGAAVAAGQGAGRGADHRGGRGVLARRRHSRRRRFLKRMKMYRLRAEVKIEICARRAVSGGTARRADLQLRDGRGDGLGTRHRAAAHGGGCDSGRTMAGRPDRRGDCRARAGFRVRRGVPARYRHGFPGRRRFQEGLLYRPGSRQPDAASRHGAAPAGDCQGVPEGGAMARRCWSASARRAPSAHRSTARPSPSFGSTASTAARRRSAACR